jgi:two-component system cell cycle sensor histidine kinase/response regulator CckA
LPHDVDHEVLAALSEGAPDGILLVDAEGRIAVANAAARRLFGVDALVGRPLELLIPARYREAHRVDWSAYVDDPVSRPLGAGLELCGIRSDGEEFPVEFSLAPLAWKGTNMTIAAVRDQSSQKRIESQRLSRVVQAGALEADALGELIGRITHDFNNELMVISSYCARLGREPALVVHERELGQIVAAAGRGIELNRQLAASARRSDQDRPNQDADMLGQDDVQAARAGEAQRHGADITAATRVGLQVWKLEDRDEPTSVRLVYANPASLAAQGIPPDAVGQTFGLLFPSADPEVAATLAKVALGGESRSGGDVTFGNDRTQAQTSSLRIFPLPESCVGVAFNDVTEQREVEARLRRAEKLEAVGSLAGGIAHDFNNVLTVIRGAAAIAMDEVGDRPVRKKLEQIDLAAEHAAALTHQLLAFSRQQVLQPEPTDLNAVVEGTLELLGHVLGEETELSRDLDPELDSVLVDPNQLQQVIMNLCVNARDAMPGGGGLALRTTTAFLDEAYSSARPEVVAGTYALLEVTDTGTGMDAASQARMFDPFYTTKAEGTGLGLATVHGIVKQSGGHIAVYSEVGLGTTFKVYLPYSHAPAVAERSPPVEVTSLEGSETILLVDDNEMLSSLVAEILEGYGYTVLTSSDGADAITVAHTQPGGIDLLLTDVVMPGMSGRELAETLVADDPHLNVLFTSGYPADTVLRHGIAETRISFIQKPFLADELANKIRTLLSR